MDFVSPFLTPVGQRAADIVMPQVAMPNAASHPMYSDPRIALGNAQMDLQREQIAASQSWPFPWRAAAAGGLVAVIAYWAWKAHTESGRS